MKHDEPRLLERTHDLLRIAGGCRDEFHALVEHKFHDVGIAHEGERDIQTERLACQRPHLFHFLAHFVEASGGCLDDAKAARVRNRGSKLRARDPPHWRLHDGIFHAQHLRDAVLDFHVQPSIARAHSTYLARRITSAAGANPKARPARSRTRWRAYTKWRRRAANRRSNAPHRRQRRCRPPPARQWRRPAPDWPAPLPGWW